MLRSFPIKYKNQTCKFRGAEILEIAPQKPLLVCFLVYKKRVVSLKKDLNRIPIRNSSKIHSCKKFFYSLSQNCNKSIVLRIALRFLIVRYFSSLVLMLLRRSFANHLSSNADYLNESINDYIQKIIA